MKGLHVLLSVALSGLLLTLLACKLDPGFDPFSLQFDVDPAYTVFSPLIRVKYVAEDPSHLCHHTLVKLADPDILILDQEEELPSATWHEHSFDLASSGQGEYSFRFAVLVEEDGAYEPINSLDQTVEFWVDTAAPAGSVSFSPPGGSYDQAVAVSLDHPELAATSGSPVAIYYTLDGGTPTSSSALYSVGTPVTLSTSATLTAAAIDQAGQSSGEASADYIIDITAPVTPQIADPPAGIYNTTLSVTLTHPEWPTSPDSPVTLYYAYGVPGSVADPDGGSAVYSGPVSINDEGPVQLKAVAIDEAGNAGAVASRTWTIDTVAPALPGFTPAGGEMSGDLNLELDHIEIPTPTGTAVQVFYTLDGSAPDGSATLYTTSIPVSKNTTCRAVAIDAAGNSSGIAEEIYTFLRIDSVDPESCSKTEPTMPGNFIIDILGYGLDKETSMVTLSDGVSVPVSCPIDPTVIDKLHLIIPEDDIKALNTGPATITVDNPNGDSESVPFTINP
jgi:hypothetical protein